MPVYSEVISLTALVVALSSTVINYLILRLRRDPDVVVYAVHDYKRPTIINLIIENIGHGTANDISFKSNRPIPERAFGFEDAQQPATMEEGPLIQGISRFVSGEKRIITWGQYGGLKKGLGDELLEVTATYYSRPALSFSRTKHRTSSTIDLRSFEGTDASDYNWDKKTAENLDKVAKALNSVTDKRTRTLKISIISDENDEN